MYHHYYFTDDEVLDDLETGTLSSPHSNGVLRKKGRMRRRFKMCGSENGALDLNEVNQISATQSGFPNVHFMSYSFYL